MAMQPRLLQGLRELGFPHILAPLEEITAAARLCTILESISLHETLADYARIVVLGALGGHFWQWHQTGSTTRGLRQDFVQHAGYRYVPLAPSSPSTSTLR